jgi:hypothetical protein
MPALGEIRIRGGRIERWNGTGWERITGPQPHYERSPGEEDGVA